MTIYREFEMMLQPNGWSCLPTSLAMLLGREPREIIEAIGHDGSEICFPDKEPPENRRAFHAQEIVDVALANFETPIFIMKQPDELPVHPDRFSNYLASAPGILLGVGQVGSPHAVAWDGERIWDPRGEKYTIDKFDPWYFLMFL